MRIREVLTLIWLYGLVARAAIWKRGSDVKNQVAKVNKSEAEDIPIDLDLLGSKAPISDVMVRALKEIQDLTDKPFCNRLAASVLLDNCRVIDQNSDSAQKTKESERREDFLKIFAASLTMCDLEALQRLVPHQCAPFGQSALLEMRNQGGEQAMPIDYSAMRSCLKTIGEESSTSLLWKHNHQSADILCQASRIDIEKESTLILFKSITRIISGVMEEVKSFFDQNRKLAREAEATNQSVQGVRVAIDKLKDNISDIWESFFSESARFKTNTQEIFEDLSNNAAEVDTLIVRLRKGTLESNAEHAAMQQRAIERATEVAIGAQNANGEIAALRDMILTIYNDMHSIGSELGAIHARQDQMDEHSAQLLQVMSNVTEQLLAASQLGEENTIMMEKATQAAWNVVEAVNIAGKKASSWSDELFKSSLPFGSSWLPMVVLPFMFVWLGSYGLPPSMPRNIGLAATGLAAAQILPMLHMDSIAEWCSWRLFFERSQQTSDQPGNESIIMTDIRIPDLSHRFAGMTAQLEENR